MFGTAGFDTDTFQARPSYPLSGDMTILCVG